MPDQDNPRLEDATDPEARTDASGFDVTAPPGLAHPMPENSGPIDDDEPGRDGWGQVDPDEEWSGDAPYPAEDAAEDFVEEPDAMQPESGQTSPADLAGDVVAQVMERLEGDPTLAIEDLSVERRGDVVVLRGIAASAEDRAHAAALALGVGGVAWVDNQLEADAGDAD